MKEATVEMGDVIKKMSDQMPESFFGHYILLPAVLTITALNNDPAVQAILILSFWNMRQWNFYLKISTKKYKTPFFFVNEQLR